MKLKNIITLKTFVIRIIFHEISYNQKVVKQTILLFIQQLYIAKSSKQ